MDGWRDSLWRATHDVPASLNAMGSLGACRGFLLRSRDHPNHQGRSRRAELRSGSNGHVHRQRASARQTGALPLPAPVLAAKRFPEPSCTALIEHSATRAAVDLLHSRRPAQMPIEMAACASSAAVSWGRELRQWSTIRLSQRRGVWASRRLLRCGKTSSRPKLAFRQMGTPSLLVAPNARVGGLSPFR